MNIFLAPIYALYSLPFYRQVSRDSLGKGFLYLIVLSFIATSFFMGAILMRILPEANRFAEWIKAEMPPLVWTRDGLEMSTPSPYTMFHEEYGPVAVFDFSNPAANLGTYPDAKVVVTPTKVYIRPRPAESRVYDLAEAAAQLEDPTQRNPVTPELVDEIYNTAKPMVILVTGVLFFLFFYVWKMIAALFYSLIGLLMNSMRQEKLSYAAVLNVSIFALTPVTLFQFLQGVFSIPTGSMEFPLSLALTSIYLFLAIKKAEEEPGSGANPV